ncbi:hypothetical protein AB6A40_010738 [Gnathostoma spinigerum]|uniref:Uncharacterized protein n=1 Tax=Gnathostoma spinigerum TaxID=75299 RepID=A0ABD6EVP1_9BILA
MCCANVLARKNSRSHDNLSHSISNYSKSIRLPEKLSKTELENETIQELSAERMTEISTTLQKMNWLSQHIDRTLHTLFAEEESVTGIGKGANNKATSLKEVSDLGHPGANEGEVILAVDKLSLLQKNGAVMVEYIDRLMGSFTRILTELEASCNRENKLKNDYQANKFKSISDFKDRGRMLDDY